MIVSVGVNVQPDSGCRVEMFDLKVALGDEICHLTVVVGRNALPNCCCGENVFHDRTCGGTCVTQQ